MISTEELDESLREACCVGNIDEARRLISNGAKINSRNRINGWTCLHWAAKRGHVLIIELLGSNGGDASIENSKGETAFNFANCENTARALLRCEKADKEQFHHAIARITTTNASSAAKGRTPFTPNYLTNPVFPHWSNDKKNKTIDRKPNAPLTTGAGRTDELLNDHRRALGDANGKANNSNTTLSDLVLKVRIEGEKDFIEIDMQTTLFADLTEVCCSELEVPRDQFSFLRKLPNTKLRNDKDVSRLNEYQELEVVCKL